MLTLLATTILCDTPCMDGLVLDPINSILLVFVGSIVYSTGVLPEGPRPYIRTDFDS